MFCTCYVPTLEKKLTDQGVMSDFGELGKYAYVPIDRARYNPYDVPILRGLADRSNCFWDELLRDLESLYKGEKKERYCGSVREFEKKKTERANKNFHAIADEMIKGKASSNNEIISFIKLFSEKGVQTERDATFNFVKIPNDDCQNKELKKIRDNATIEYLEKALDKELKKKLITSSHYKIL